MANNEVRTLKSNSFEEWRQKTNEQSFEAGDVDQLESRLTDKVYDYTGVSSRLFTGTDSNNKTLRFETQPEVTTDILHCVIFKNSPTIESQWVADKEVYQGSSGSETYKAKILWINNKKVALSTISGTFNAGADFKQTTDGTTQTIAHANLERVVTESVNNGYIKVKVAGSEISQSQVQAGFHIPNFALKVTLTGSPTVPAEFTEGVTLTQAGGFSGILLSASTTTLRFKSSTGSFNTGQLVQVSGDSSKRILAANISAIEVQDTTFENIIELHTVTSGGGGQAIQITAHSLVDAVNELQDDIGNLTLTGLSATDLSAAARELRTELGNHASLGTTHTADVVGAVNELETAVRGSTGNYTIGTDSNDLVGAVNELETALRGSTANYNISTTSNDVVGALNEHDAELGTITAGAMGTTASTVSTAILELEQEIDVLNARVEPTQAFAGTFSSSTIMDGLNELITDIGDVTAGNMGTSASTVVGAINEVENEVDTLNTFVEPSQSLTTSASTLADAINELDSQLGTAVITGSGTEAVGAANITTAVNLLNTALGDSDSYNDGTYGANTIAGTLDLLQAGMISNDTDIAARLIKVSGSSQTLETDLAFGGSKTYTVTSGSTLEIASGATLSIAGSSSGVSTFGVSYLEVDGNQTSTGMGLKVNRAHIGSSPTPYPAVQWRESQVGASKGHRGWQIVGTNAAGSSSVTSDIVTFYNAEDLISSNTESGIAVTWDSTNQNFDFNVADFTITLGGDLTGNVTITDLASATLTATVAANSVALGTDTTGNYMSGISGTANEITVTHTPGEGSSAVIALPDDVTIGNNLVVTDYTRSAGLRVGTSGSDPGDNNLAVDGNATIAGNTTITGNLTVNGTQTILNTSTITAEDTLVLAGNNLTSEPASGGFGIEAGPIITQTVDGAVSSSTSVTLDSGTGVKVGQGVYGTGVASGATVSAISGTTLTLSAASSIADGATLTFSHVTKASNVTGSHSIVYNYATNRWEADGSLILSNATNTPPTIESNDFGAGKNLDFVNGTGITAVTSTSGSDIDVTITNTDRGSSQLFYKTFTGDSGSAVASANNDTIDIEGGNAITTAGSADKITINHADTSSLANIDNSAGTVIQDLTFDTYGHVTGAASLDLDGRYYREDEFATANTASKGVFRDGSGNFAAGTITATLSGTATNADNINIDEENSNTDHQVIFSPVGGAGYERLHIDTDDGHFVYNPSSNNLSGLNIVTATNFNGIASHVTTSHSDTNASYPMVWRSGNSVYYTDEIYCNPSTNTLYATTFNGELIGNATSASKVYVAGGSTNASYRMVFGEANDGSNANESLYKDTAANFTYNPSTNTLTVPNITGTASLATNVTATANNGTNETTYLTFVDGATGSQGIETDTGLTYNPSSNTITGNLTGNVTGNLTGTASSVTIAHSDSNANYPLMWRSGNNAHYTDEVYLNASTNQVTASQFNGSLNGNANSANAAYVTNTEGNGNYRMVFVGNNSSASQHESLYKTSGITVNASTEAITATTFIGALSGHASTAGSITSQANSATITCTNANTANQIVKRDGSGNFSAGTISAALTGNVTGNVSGSSGSCTGNAATATTATKISMTDHNGNASYPLVHQTAANTVKYDSGVYMNASSNIVYATDFIASSDERQKDIIEPITGALDKVCAIDGFIYKWNDKAASLDKETRQVGVSAQAVQAVLPEAVNEKDDGYLGVAYDKLVPLLIESIKELKAEVEELKRINS